MLRRRLGAGGPEISAIGLGCMSFAGFFGATDLDESHRCLDAAIAHGIDFLDTANVYGPGLSEQVIGSWLAKRKPRVMIATKVGVLRGADRQFDNSAAHIRAELDASLRRLGVERIDLYYIHRREQERPIEEVVDTLAGLVREGKIGGYGLSEVSPATLRRAHAVHPCLAVQSEYSLWTRYPELGMIQTCAALGVTFVPFSPLARGVFSQTYPDTAVMAEGDYRRSIPRFSPDNYPRNRAIIDGFKAFAQTRGWTVAAAALAWVLDRGQHVVPIPGTRNAAHLAEWAGADAIRLNDDDRAEIDRLLPVGFAHGDRYGDAQIIGVERYA